MNYEKAQETAEFIKSKYAKPIDTALVLGSGLGAFADEVENRVVIAYEEIPQCLLAIVNAVFDQCPQISWCEL
jgi:purine nucleoside phosphorylase